MVSSGENHEVSVGPVNGASRLARVQRLLGALRQLPRQSLLVRGLLLGGIVVAAEAVVLPLRWLISGDWIGFFAAAVAGGVCLLAGWAALVLSEPLRRPREVLALVFVGMMVRMGIPLSAALAAFFFGGPLADAGFLYYLVVFYPVTLAGEAFLSSPGREPNRTNIPPAGDFVG